MAAYFHDWAVSGTKMKRIKRRNLKSDAAF